jgi:outer membrane protein OmpA-like peptidoglycan-associated protein
MRPFSGTRSGGILLLPGIIALAPAGKGNPPSPAPEPSPSAEAPGTRSAKAIQYRFLEGSTVLGFRGTERAPQAEGVAKVKARPGEARIKATFRHLVPPAGLQAGCNTYILWALSPSGRPLNLGEALPTARGHARVSASVPLQVFALVLTAEPHFAVEQMSGLVVAENEVTGRTKGHLEEVTLHYPVLPPGSYPMAGSGGGEGGGNRRPSPSLLQARTAVAMARGAGAEQLAPEAIAKAKASLDQAEGEGGKGGKAAILLARQTVQLGEDARRLAVERAQELRVAGERQAAEEESQAALRSRAAAEQARETAARETEMAREQVTQVAREVSVQRLQARLQLRERLKTLLHVEETERGLLLRIDGVLFAPGQARLLPAARVGQARIAGILAAHPGLKVQVVGHTDGAGGEAVNRSLSRRRAEAVRAFLVRQGLPAGSVTAQGAGNAHPIASDATHAGRQLNRRIELLVSGEAIGF